MALSYTPAHAATTVLEIPDLDVQVRVPIGWRVVKTVAGEGVAISKPYGVGPVLEVLVWDPVAENPSVAEAAIAHEQVLSATLSYSRTSHRPFLAADGTQALLALGTVSVGDGSTQRALFAAYLMDGRYLVVGTFCTPESLAEYRESFFDDAISTFSRRGLSLPAAGAGPVSPPAPEPEPPIQMPERHAPAPPVGSGAESPTPPELTGHSDPLGFTLQAPRGWVVQVNRGCVMVGPASKPRDQLVCVLPLLRGADATIQERANDAAGQWAAILGAKWKPLQTRLAAGSDISAVCAGETQLDGSRAQAVCILAPSPRVDLLAVAVFRPGATEQERTVLAGILGSFQLGPLWALTPSGETRGPWVSEDGGLEAQVGGGWVVGGRLDLYNGQLTIEAHGRHVATGASFTWRQPEVPFYKHPTPDLAAAGWREGSEFPPDRGVQPLVLQKRPREIAACRSRAIAGTAMTVTSSGPEPRGAKLLAQGRGAFAHTRGKQTEAACLLALADAPPDIGTDCWLAASLRYQGAPDNYQAAGAALSKLIRTAQPPPGSSGPPAHEAALASLLEGARAASAALPSSGPELPAHTGLLPVLNLVVPEESAGAERLELSNSAASLWKSAATAAGANENLPELLADWWAGRQGDAG